jgi:hypothetical protein
MAHKYSDTSFRLIARFESFSALGTAFLFWSGAEHYLVTAWHNLTGRNFVTKQSIAKWHPVTIEVELPIEISAHEIEHEDFRGDLGVQKCVVQLYANGERPVWLVDEKLGSAVDIAVIPISTIAEQYKSQDREVSNCLNLLNKTPEYTTYHKQRIRFLSHSKPDFKGSLHVTDDVFAIGFPSGVSGGLGSAIWKKGSIASEPEFDFGKRRCFLIDSATREGLSGSPVVGRYLNPSIAIEGSEATIIGNRLGFCGVYTASLIDPAVEHRLFSAQLGIVWKISIIDDIITKGKVGVSALDFEELEKEEKDLKLI